MRQHCGGYSSSGAGLVGQRPALAGASHPLARCQDYRAEAPARLAASYNGQRACAPMGRIISCCVVARTLLQLARWRRSLVACRLMMESFTPSGIWLLTSLERVKCLLYFLITSWPFTGNLYSAAVLSQESVPARPRPLPSFRAFLSFGCYASPLRLPLLGSKVVPFLKGPFQVFILVFIPHADGCVVSHVGILVVIDGHQRYAYACTLSVTGATFGGQRRFQQVG